MTQAQIAAQAIISAAKRVGADTVAIRPNLWQEGGPAFSGHLLRRGVPVLSTGGAEWANVQLNQPIATELQAAGLKVES